MLKVKKKTLEANHKSSEKCENYFWVVKFLPNLILQHTGSYLKCRHERQDELSDLESIL